MGIVHFSATPPKPPFPTSLAIPLNMLLSLGPHTIAPPESLTISRASGGVGGWNKRNNLMDISIFLTNIPMIERKPFEFF
jgi:hypothetical protein